MELQIKQEDDFIVRSKELDRMVSGYDDFNWVEGK